MPYLKPCHHQTVWGYGIKILSLSTITDLMCAKAQRWVKYMLVNIIHTILKVWIYFWRVMCGTSAVEAPATSLSWGGCCSTWFQRPAAAILLHFRLQLISCSRGCASGEHLKCPTICLPLATASLTARCDRSPSLTSWIVRATQLKLRTLTLTHTLTCT